MKFTCGDCVKVIKDSEKLHAGMSASIVRECKDEGAYWIYVFENNRYQNCIYVTNVDDTFELQEKEIVTVEELKKYARGELTHAGLLHYHSLPCAFASKEKYEYTINDVYKFLVKYSKKELKSNEIEKWFTFVIFNVYDAYQTYNFLVDKPNNKIEEVLFEIFNEMDIELACTSEYAECPYFDVDKWIRKIEPFVDEK